MGNAVNNLNLGILVPTGDPELFETRQQTPKSFTPRHLGGYQRRTVDVTRAEPGRAPAGWQCEKVVLTAFNVTGSFYGVTVSDSRRADHRVSKPLQRVSKNFHPSGRNAHLLAKDLSGSPFLKVSNRASLATHSLSVSCSPFRPPRRNWSLGGLPSHHLPR